MTNHKEKAINFIIKELHSFINSFPQTRVRYEFDINANVHCVEVVPNKVYHLNEEYISWENEFTDCFIASFPNQNICFFSDDAIIGIKNVQFELVGKSFIDLISSSKPELVISVDSLSFTSSNKFLGIKDLSTASGIYNVSSSYRINQSSKVIEPVNSIGYGVAQDLDCFTGMFSLAA